MNKKLLGFILYGVVLLGLGFGLGYLIFHSCECKCQTIKQTESKKINTPEELVEKYSIVAKSNGGDSIHGYRVQKQGDKYLVIISMGLKNTGGYSIGVTNVEEKDDGVVITVQEVSPAIGDIVTQAFTSPYVSLLVDSSNVKVIATTGYIYSKYEK